MVCPSQAKCVCCETNGCKCRICDLSLWDAICFIEQQIIREGANYSTNQPVHTNRLNMGCDELWCGEVVELAKIPIRLGFHYRCRVSFKPNTINTKSKLFGLTK